jgi:Glycosyl transferases group 1
VLVEGMAAGLPVVASRIPGYAEVLPATCGLLVPPFDAVALARGLERFLADADLCGEARRHGRLEAQRYAWDVVVERILELYERARAQPATTSSSRSGAVSRGSKSIRRATSSLRGRVPSRKISRRRWPVSERSHQSSPTSVLR